MSARSSLNDYVEDIMQATQGQEIILTTSDAPTQDVNDAATTSLFSVFL